MDRFVATPVRGKRLSENPLVMILGTAEWDAVIATNQHYVTRELSKAFSVVFVEGMGTRRLRLSPSDVRRVARRVHRRSGRTTSTHRPLPENTRVISPRVIPIHTGATARLNRRLLPRQLRSWLGHAGPRVLWTYSPYTYGLEHHADVVVYHLVDLLHHNPGVDKSALLAAENQLGRTAGIAIATSPAIAEHLRRQGFRAVFERPNVAEIAPFLAAAESAASSHRIVVFAGALSPHKLDIDLLVELSRALGDRGQLHLIGPMASGAETHPAWPLLRRHGARLFPPLALHDLATRVAQASVGIIPYQNNNLTSGISPLKTHEYLAAGLPVVATALPAVTPHPGSVYVEPAHDAFIGRVLSLLSSPRTEPERRVRQALAQQHDWASRGREFRGMVWDALAEHPQ